MAFRLALAAALLLAACVRTQGNVLTSIDGGTCRGLPCGGCCDGNGVCRVGDTANACGTGGAQCAACSATQVCTSSVCVADAGVDAGPVTCRPCETSDTCGPTANCVQYGNSDYCGVVCNQELDCPAGQACVPALTFNGIVVAVCAPANGSCGGTGCGTCPAGTRCDVTTATCDPVNDGGLPGTCGTLVPPSASSCCHSCTPGTGDCQPNGCYGGWWCDISGTSCHCRPPPTSCGDAGTSNDGGVYDGGAPTGAVGPDGGTVSRLYFAVVGDTRPANLDDTSNYPTAVINRIYQDIAALNPPVQFVLDTGDHVFANPAGPEGANQMALYASAMHAFSRGPIFGLIGNQDCAGLTDANCPPGTTGNNNYSAFMSTFVTTLGKTTPYYGLHFAAQDGSWTAKLLIIACNSWDLAQQGWLAAALAQPTTYTFIARHEPVGTSGIPCSDADPLINAATYNQLLAGHLHTYEHASKAVIVGNGGAPTTATWGFVTVEQQPGIGFKVTEYDYATAAPLDTWYFQ